ncbi:MAG: chemotaxis protein CheW [Treponema sp.]|nr:chemotaxis protein CheW [Treponema sp.]MCL2237211.1 chemotaxis protein CheW [Treponema sp.]
MTERFLVFSIKDKKFALPSNIIGEVTLIEKIFPLPLVPDYVRGMINRYSIPYALIDISLFFKNEASCGEKVIVLKGEYEKTAFLIDDVVDIVDLSSSELVKIENETDQSNNFSGGGFDSSVNACFDFKEEKVLCLNADELTSRIKTDFDRGANK